MSKLETHVPPLELCQKIPAGEFEDSYAIYVHIYGEWLLMPVDDCASDIKKTHSYCPAPTLEEILYNMPPTYRFRLLEWRNEKNIAEKILKFWLEIERD